jgi:hypothetical protein
MGRLLLRLAGLVVVGTIVYTAVAEIAFEGPDKRIVNTLLAAAVLAAAAGIVMRVAGRATAAVVARACPRCGRRVARGRVYCDEHLQETINEYRDRERSGGRRGEGGGGD